MKHYKEYKYILINETITNTVNELSEIINFNLLLDSIKQKVKNYKIL